MKEVFNRIAKDILAYVACVLVVIFGWSWVFSYLTTVKYEEKVTIFIGSHTLDFDKTEVLNEDKPEYLKLVDVQTYLVNDSMFSACLNAVGYGVGDILILPEKYIIQEGCSDYYAEISMEYQTQFQNLGFHEEEGRVYGIKIHDKETHESVIDCIDYGEGEQEENYYLVFNKDSYHLSDLSTAENKSDMDGAIQVAKRLFAL